MPTPNEAAEFKFLLVQEATTHKKRRRDAAQSWLVGRGPCAASSPLQAEGFVITAQHIRVATEVLQKAGRLRVSSRRGTGGGRHLDPRTSAELTRRLGSSFEVFEDDMDEGEILEKNERLDMVIVRARQEAQL